jgi:hypothetical protein
VLLGRFYFESYKRLWCGLEVLLLKVAAMRLKLLRILVKEETRVEIEGKSFKILPYRPDKVQDVSPYSFLHLQLLWLIIVDFLSQIKRLWLTYVVFFW